MRQTIKEVVLAFAICWLCSFALTGCFVDKNIVYQVITK